MEIQQTQPEETKLYDGEDIGRQFINFFYTSWSTNQDALTEVILHYSKLKYNNIIYSGNDFINCLKLFASSGIQFTNCRFELLDSQSRQIYILVSGQLNQTHFQQSFVLSYAGSKKMRQWVVISSLLII